jgi:hypothetical protein
MSAGHNRHAAAAADIARLSASIASVTANNKVNQGRVNSNPAAVTARSTASALGQPFNGQVLTPTEIAVIEQEIEGGERALELLTAQKRRAEAELAAAEQEMRGEKAAYLRSTIIPPLLEAAQMTGAEFGTALAKLAAAEDLAIRFARPTGEPFATGNTGRFVDGMNSGTGSNVFFDLGPGRGVWDMPHYYPASAVIEEQLREAVQ